MEPALTSPRFRVPVAVVAALVMQMTVLAQVRPQGVRPDALLLLAVCGGIVGGAERGALLGFTAGLLNDLFLETPFGLSALVFSLVAFAVGSFQTGVLRAAWWIPVATTVVGSGAGVVLYAMLGAVVGQAHMVEPRLAVITALVAAMNGVLSLLAVRLVGWAFAGVPSERTFA